MAGTQVGGRSLWGPDRDRKAGSRAVGILRSKKQSTGALRGWDRLGGLG